MELVSVAKVSLVLIAQFIHALMIVFPVVNALTTPAFVLQDGLILIALLNFAPTIAVEMDIVKMDPVFVILTSADLIAKPQHALEIAMEMEFAWMELAGANQDMEEMTAVLKLVQMIVVMLVGATMEHAFATQNMLELIAKSIKKTFTFQLNVLWTVFTDAWANVHMFILMTVLDHPVNAMCNAHENVYLLVLGQIQPLTELSL